MYLGIPKFFWYSSVGDCNAMIIELLGPNLEKLLKLCGKKFSITTVAQLGVKMLEIIEHLHSKGFIHRDIKPDNFVIGNQENVTSLYTIDFGLCKRYCDHDTGFHIPFRENMPLAGTVRYTSINSHFGFEQSRRDDIESLAYVLIYLLKGKLPWQKLKGCNKKDKYNKIMYMKMSVPVEILCKNLPRTHL